MRSLNVNFANNIEDYPGPAHIKIQRGVPPCRYTPPPPPASLHAIQICGVKLWPIANCITRNNLLFAKSKECEMIKAAIMAYFFTAKAKWWPSYEPTREKVHPSTHSARVKDADAQHTHSTGSCVTSPALQFWKFRRVKKNETNLNLYFKWRCNSCIELLGKYVK